MSDLIERMRLLELDHEPDGWPAVRMRDITALLDALEAARADAGRGAMVTMALRAAVTALAHASASDPVYTSVYQHTSEALRYYAIDAAMAAEGRNG